MPLVIAFISLLFLSYAYMMWYFYVQWKKIPEAGPITALPSGLISVIIAARNEGEHIGNLLDALQAQTLDKKYFEVIVVDDHSTDDTAFIASRYNGVHVIRLNTDHKNSYKKKAIEAGIHQAKGSLIITTDADCIPPLNWLATVGGFQALTQADFVAAPVAFTHSNRFIEIFQVLDFLTLQGITAVGIHARLFGMCNGANMVYKKDVFKKVDGFASIDQVASGDDMLLLQKIWIQDYTAVHYIKSKAAIVNTQPMHTWKQFINQRIRWASKANLYRNNNMNLVIILVYLLNCSFPVLLIAGFWNPGFWLMFIALLLLKTLVEFPFVNAVSNFYNKQQLMKYFIIFQPVHIIYTVLAGLFGQMGSYEWKGRKVK